MSKHKRGSTRALRVTITVSQKQWKKLENYRPLWAETAVEKEAAEAWAAEKERLLRWVQRKMRQQLRPRERAALELIYFERRTAAEAAERLHLHRSTVQAIKRRAIGKLQEAARAEGITVRRR